MLGPWIAQWYLKVPAFGNVTVLLVPPAIFPVSQTPVSLVEVWVIPSLFCHVTVVPFETVSVPGLNAIFMMTTVLGGGGLEDPELLPYGFDESLLQPKIPINAISTTSNAAQMTPFFIAPPRYS